MTRDQQPRDLSKEERVAQLRRLIRTADEFFAMCQKPVPVDGIPGEFDRALHISAWRALEAKHLPGIAHMRAQYAAELERLL